MKHYLIEESEIQTASDNGIVVVWLESYDQPGVVVTPDSSKVFGDKEVVDL